MAVVKPFRGIRPPQEMVEQVASRPYDVLNSAEARAEAAGNENHFIILSSLKLIFRKELTSMIRVCTIKLCRTFRCFRTRDGWCRIRKTVTISMHRP